MKTSLLKKARNRGYASLAMVAVIAVVTGTGLMYSFRRSVRSHDAQAITQIKIDQAQKEDALLRSLVALIPNRAIGAMRHNSAASPGNFSWEGIFTDAIELANAEEAIDSVTITSLGLDDAIVANPGDGEIADPDDIVDPILGGGGFLNSGTETSSALLLSSQFGPKLPDPLKGPSGVMANDEDFPIISREKVFSDGYNTQAQLSISDYPLYNVIPYPNIRFGYKQPGDPFVAKRNWWAFSVRFGNHQPDSPAPAITKHYVLSIYEVPSQMPISADAFLSVGAHADGTEWMSTSVDGGISAGILETSDYFNLPTGQMTGRDAMIVGSGTQVLGKTVNNTFDDLGVRETLHASQQNDQYVASLAANSGRVAFIPINRGLDFYRLADVPESNTISTTGWDQYSTGAAQCRMKVRVTGVKDTLDQTPTRIEFKFLSGGSEQTVTLDRASNWPFEGQPGAEDIPFQTEHLEVGRKALVIYMEKLPLFMSISSGAPVPQLAEENHSLLIEVDPSADPNITEPEFPTTGQEVALVLRDTRDFSIFSKGFSLVTNLRLYLADNFNQVAVAPPAGAGIPAGKPFFPPVSLFAPEQRYGTTLKIRPVEYSGQVGSLAEGDNFAIHPLDFRAGTFETVTPGLIEADLVPIDSPAELPPIFLMNWLITVEEIRPASSGS